MAFIEIRNLWKEYGDQVVLEHINSHIDEGEFITIVGASGCGKTTFLNLMLGTESASRGGIYLQGSPLADEPGPERGIVFQRYSVFPHLSVLQNVLLAEEFTKSRWLGRLFGASRQAAIERAREMLNAVGLGHAENKYPHELSGGMQQRLSIAQSLIKKPRILLLDEPFGALDPGIRADMHALVLSLWKKYKLTIFMITHDIKEGFYLGTRLWVFDKTRVDPQAQGAYGAQITYDLPVGETGAEVFAQLTADSQIQEDKINAGELEVVND